MASHKAFLTRGAAFALATALVCYAAAADRFATNKNDEGDVKGFPETKNDLLTNAKEGGHGLDRRGLLDALLQLHGSSNSLPIFNLYVEITAKGYVPDSEEWVGRQAIFFQNLEFIQNHNSNTSSSFQLGLNDFSDWTDNEFQATFLNGIIRDVDWLPPSVPEPDKNPTQYLAFDYEHYVLSERSVDWRKAGVVGPVKNQHINGSSCGCCWAFATAAAIETAVALSSGEPAVSLSEQQLVSCDYHNGSKTENVGCSGGSWWLGMDYVINNNGISTEDEYPYLAHDAKCEEQKEANSQTGKFTISGYQFIDSFNETALLATVAHQPALAEICVGDDFVKYWKTYRGGVYNIEGCMEPIDHGVLLVGFDLDDNDGKGSWIIKNSWGAEWGESGFMRAAMGLGPEPAPGKRQGIMNLQHRAAFPRLSQNTNGIVKLSRSSLRSQTGSSVQ